MSEQEVTVLLMVYGLAGFGGSYLFNRFFSRRGWQFFVFCCLIMPISMLLLLPLSAHWWALLPICLLWDVGITALSLAMVSKVLHFAADAADVAAAIYSSLYNIGIGGGALPGHYASLWFGLDDIGAAGAVLAAGGLALSVMLVTRDDFEQKKPVV